ncbi:sigma-70 family RNA polymerase sigma factor [uncultured Muriicola sp.]|uniref:RNA polymerase sigma factor n=1 Tax=uncultured Muriicola sp. TaxID=1583102 RepID=UPI002617D609|nr:sigma-70 family RNA polymerase sigma factor [uncultured Muriicola sp.]
MAKELYNDICKEDIFKSVYNKYAQELNDYLYYKYGEQCSPNDKTQEAFIKLWENCKKVVLSKARGFLYTVANNMVFNDFKHQKVVLRYKQEKPKGHTNENPEFLMEKEQYLLKYQKALSKLSEEQRVAFMLNKVEGKKHQEIAEMLGVTRKVVEYRIYSAFTLLKTELENFKI